MFPGLRDYFYGFCEFSVLVDSFYSFSNPKNLPRTQPMASPIRTENGIPNRTLTIATSFALVSASSNWNSEITRNAIPIINPNAAPISADLLNLNSVDPLRWYADPLSSVICFVFVLARISVSYVHSIITRFKDDRNNATLPTRVWIIIGMPTYRRRETIVVRQQ